MKSRIQMSHSLNHKGRAYPARHFVCAWHGSDDAAIVEAHHTRFFVDWGDSIFDFQIISEFCGSYIRRRSYLFWLFSSCDDRSTSLHSLILFINIFVVYPLPEDVGVVRAMMGAEYPPYRGPESIEMKG